MITFFTHSANFNLKSIQPPPLWKYTIHHKIKYLFYYYITIKNWSKNKNSVWFLGVAVLNSFLWKRNTTGCLPLSNCFNLLPTNKCHYRLLNLEIICNQSCFSYVPLHENHQAHPEPPSTTPKCSEKTKVTTGYSPTFPFL